MKFNPVGWFEIYVQDINRSKTFYEAVLSIELNSMNSGSDTMKMLAFPSEFGQPGTGGSLVQMDGVPSGGNSVLVYFICEDCAVQAARAVANGGKVFKEKTSIGEYGFIVLAVDTEGNMFGLHSMK